MFNKKLAQKVFFRTLFSPKKEFIQVRSREIFCLEEFLCFCLTNSAFISDLSKHECQLTTELFALNFSDLKQLFLHV